MSPDRVCMSRRNTSESAAARRSSAASAAPVNTGSWKAPTQACARCTSAPSGAPARPPQRPAFTCARAARPDAALRPPRLASGRTSSLPLSQL